MAKVIRRGVEMNTVGDLPPVGKIAPDFVLVNKDYKDVTLKNFAGYCGACVPW